MRNTRGFTLIELLAVIVILAIILVIATPQILGVIEQSKKDAFAASAKMYASAIETKYLTSMASDSPIDLQASYVTCSTISDNIIDFNGASACTFKLEIVNGAPVATVRLTGQNKFLGLYACNATKNSATIQATACS